MTTENTIQKRVGFGTPQCRTRRRNSDCTNDVKSDYSFCKARKVTSLIRSTSTPSYANLDVCSSSSFVTIATPLTSSSVSSHRLCLSGCEDSSSDICNAVGSSNHSYSSPGHKSDLHLRLPSSISDDDMSANSPDSGFESTTPSGSTGSGDFDETSKSDAFEELLKSSTQFFDPGSLKASPLCLKPPSKPKTPSTEKERRILCRWKNCGCSFQNSRDLHTHLTREHIDNIKDRFCCCWLGCKVYDRPSRSIAWLRQHVTTHTGDKRFKCIVGGCEASFASQEGYQRHVSSHFNDVNLPKAKPNGHERKYLVKRRKIKDEMTALANTHDCMDERVMNVIRESLVEFTCSVGMLPKSCTLKHDDQGISNQVCKIGARLECPTYRYTWNENHNDLSRLLFFETPRKRSRKYEACD